VQKGAEVRIGGYAVARPSIAKALVDRRNGRPTWFVSAHGMYRNGGITLSWVPAGSVHLKKLGVPRTACGRNTLGWQVFWLDPPSDHLGLCVQCLEAVEHRADDAKS
jgi:hypothetical protein